MIGHLGGDYYWEITEIGISGASKAILRSSKTCDIKRSQTIDMSGFPKWLYENIETLDGNTEAQNRVIYWLEKMGQRDYTIIREGKIIFS